MTTAERLSHFEAMSAEARERGVSLLLADYEEMARLRTLVTLEERSKAKARETE